ncbi:uncharacterized protein [Physcomitrium patens]|uniref:uncharacterized protein isoform X2 n=1 Tax=Physcomitrium patens TaxID=3218 RepID=UPI003CCCDC38
MIGLAARSPRSFSERWMCWKCERRSKEEIAKSFWDDLTQNDEQLFAQTPPIMDERESSPSYFAECSQESGSVSPSNYAHENCGRIKRRRMLHFSGTGEECVPASSPPFESSSANDLPFVSCVNPIVSAAEEFLVPVPSSPSNIWFPKESPTTINAISEEAGKGADEKWMSKCLDHKELHSPPEKSKIVVRSANHSEGSGMSAQSSPSSEGEVLQGPLTPFSKGSTPGWMPSPLTRFRVKATPVAYPFNLVKPCSAHGDVTLSDINQRIKVSSPSSSRRQPPRDGEKSPTQSGSGLSGKAVVECIKLHTEGKGSITIMKTRG